MMRPPSTFSVRNLRLSTLCAAVAILAVCAPAIAQESGNSAAGQPDSGPNGAETVSPRTQPDVPDFGESPNLTEPLGDTPENDGPMASEAMEDAGGESDRLVEVSLGDWDVKNELAEALDLRVSEVPLTIEVPAEIASTVCPLSDEDLEQQETIAAVSTCAAKNLSDELMEEARTQLASGESNSSAMRDAQSADQDAEAADDQDADPTSASDGSESALSDEEMSPPSSDTSGGSNAGSVQDGSQTGSANR